MMRRNEQFCKCFKFSFFLFYVIINLKYYNIHLFVKHMLFWPIHPINTLFAKNIFYLEIKQSYQNENVTTIKNEYCEFFAMKFLWNHW